MNEQQDLTNWVSQQFQRANKYLAEQGILFSTVVTEESRYLAPYIAVWKIKDNKSKFYWVISGDVPADALSVDVASNARDAIKHFSLTWQLKADSIQNNPSSDRTQLDYADLLVEKAELIYAIQEQQQVWQGN